MEVKIIVLSFLILLEAALFVISTIGNILVIIVMTKQKALRKASGYNFIIAIAVTDLISDAFAIPFTVHSVLEESQTNYDYCIWMTSFLLILFAISISLLVALSVDRYWAVCHPISYFNHRTCSYQNWIIFLCFAIGFSSGILPVFGWNSGEFHNNCNFVQLSNFKYLLFCSCCVLISTCVIIVLYSLIYKSIVVRVETRYSRDDQSAENDNHEAEVRVAKTMILVIGSFLICWMPLILNLLYAAITENRDYSSTYRRLIDLATLLLSHLNPAIDPFIYAFRVKDVRDAISRMFRCKNHNDAVTQINSSVATL